MRPYVPILPRDASQGPTLIVPALETGNATLTSWIADSSSIQTRRTRFRSSRMPSPTRGFEAAGSAPSSDSGSGSA